MAWAKLDDQFHGHPKVLAAWHKSHTSLGLHMLAMSYCAAYDTGGLVPSHLPSMYVPSEEERAIALSALTATSAKFRNGLWVEVADGWQIHDWDEYNGSAVKREEVREAKRRAGRAGAAARWGDGRDMAAAKQPANGTAMAPSPSPNPTTRANALVSQADVVAVFDAWREATGKAGAKLDDKRRRLIRQRLGTYPVADLVAAVRGWRHSPHHRGENDRRTVYNDIELLLRDAKHIEMFSDLERGRNGKPEMSSADFVRALNG